MADVSGVVTDFMQSLKPFAMVATGDETDVFRARFPSSRAAYVIQWDLSTLDGALMRCWATTPRTHPDGRVGTTSEALKTENRLVPLSGSCSRWPWI